MRTLVQVLVQPRYLLVALFVAWLTLSLAIMVPNWMLIWFGLGIGGMSFAASATFVASFYGSLLTNFTVLSGVVTVLMSLLFGLNVALLVFYIRMMRGSTASVRTVETLTLGGLVSGFFGIGCAVCGSVILTSLLGLIGATGLLVYLPLHGEELSFLGLGLLGYGLFLLVRKIEQGSVC